MRTRALLELARAIDPARAGNLEGRFSAWAKDAPQAAALATVVATAFPAFASMADARPSAFVELCAEGWRAERTRAGLVGTLQARASNLDDGDGVRAALRLTLQQEKLRIATRELLPRSLYGADVDTTAREIAELAEAAIEIALAEAMHHARVRWGPPLTNEGAPSTFVVLGMGKLGGRELNAGSDIDVIYFYDTDEGSAVPPDGSEPLSLHEYWSRVGRRLTANLDAATAEGMAWRVDLRLRPEGSRGPIANSLPAAERYYETFGRLWERVALLRARPVAGDLALGRAVLEELTPFVYARHVDPSVATEIIKLAERARAELSDDPALDLKLGPGGIRDAELFVQTLQLIWGGNQPRVRATGTLDALRRLRGRGLVTDREGRDVADAYVLFRRLEHRVQWATGLQTHSLPTDPAERLRLARSLGHASAEELDLDIERARKKVSTRLASLLPKGVAKPAEPGRFAELMQRLDEGDPAAALQALVRAFAGAATAELCRDIEQMARRPDDLLGSITRERFPELGPGFLDALIDAADPEQAARYFRTWLGRLSAPGVYVRPLGEDLRALRRLVAAFGASALIGNAIADHPELGDRVVFTRRVPDRESARQEVEHELSVPEAAMASNDDPDAFVGALRRAKARVTVEVALADLAGEIGTREATLTLSGLADATLEHATRFALGAPEKVRGLAVIAVGKLGGNEIGYGSDLDVLFVFDPAFAPDNTDPHAYFAKRAQQVIRLVSTAHAEGPGYELDTRLRPSGSHGLLVTSLSAFARYHDVGLPGQALPSENVPAAQSGAPWERQALIRARLAAGDTALGEAFLRVAHVAAYERGAPPKAELHRLRMRMEHELGRERPGRHDLKVGLGGLCDIEFAVQYLQMVAGRDARVRSTETQLAMTTLADLGLLRADLAETLDEGYRFLRRLEQRIRVVHGSSSSLLDEGAEGLLPLARRMGFRDTPRSTAIEDMVARYRDVTEGVRRAYLEVIA
ncbi:MAG TPA: bifunctional [glutamate--ammonia ligase]-adenylyl-L-tyrosine phosphorylase/[glutamate--ammonia-ligase] adenylyltransferase [Polyangiaceae bacterium]|nr:bifunctional [glutamate--ammonia ligase]-adenylyl-L-tyrosine phosphorylase/[glutamate--ammonia-ligase] adenylyltransferase [Polyangiaceae bacterium]